MIVYVVARVDKTGMVRDIGPEIFTDEQEAWDAVDRWNKRKAFYRERDYEVIKRRLV